MLLLLFAPGWHWGLPSEFDCDPDSPVPLSPLAFIGDYFNSNISNKYPAVHQLLLLPFYALVMGYYKLTGGLQRISAAWPNGFRDPVAAFSSLIVVSRIVTGLMAAGTILCIRRLPFKELDKRARYVAMLLIAGSGVFVYYARAGNVDVPYLFWWSVSFLLLAIFVSDSKAPHRCLILSAMCSAMSIGTKDQAAGLVLGSGLILLLINRSPTEMIGARLRHATLYTSITFLSYAVVAVLPQPVRWLNHVRRDSLGSPDMTQWIQFENNLSGQIGLLGATLTRLTHVLSPVGTLFAIVGLIALIAARRYRVTAFLLLPVISYYGFFIFNIRFVYERFLLPLAFLLLIVAGIGVSSFLKALEKKPWAYNFARLAIAAALAYHFLSGYLPITYLQVFDIKADASRSVGSYVAPGSRILWNGGYVNLPNAVVYEHYRLVLPPGGDIPQKNMKHAFAGEGSGFLYILSDNPELVDGGNKVLLDKKEVELVHSWQYPTWVRNGIHFSFQPRQYFLYQKRKNGSIPDTVDPAIR